MFHLPLIRVKRIQGRTTKNRILYVVINPGIHLTSANLAKEVAEARWFYNPINIIRGCFFSREYSQKRKIVAHETKVQVLALFYGKSEKDCRTAEAWAMIKRYDGLFNDRSLSWIKEEMAHVRRSRREWVIKKAKLLRKHRMYVAKVRKELDD